MEQPGQETVAPGRPARIDARFVAAALLPGLAWLALVGLTILGLLGFQVRRPRFEAAGLALGAGLLAAAFLLRGNQALSRGASGVARPVYVWLVPAVAALLSYGWSINLGPLSDDYVLRAWAVDGQWVPGAWTFTRPLPLALWQVLATMGGGWTAIHGLNVLVHAVNSALVAGMSAGWMGPRAGLAAGLVFAGFPASAEAVAWSAGVFDLLASAAALLAVTVWQRVAPSPGRTAILVALCVVGMLCKESAVVIPGLLILIALTSANTPAEALTRMRSLLLPVAVAAGFVVTRALSSDAVTGHLGNLPSSRRQWKDLLVRPFGGVALPLRADAGPSAETYVLGLLVLIVVGVAIARALAPPRHASVDAGAEGSTGAVLALGGGWILITALPLLMTFYVSATLEGSRYLYLSSAGFALALSSSLSGPSIVSRVVAPTATIAILAIYGTRLNEERQIWQRAAALRDSLLSQASQIAETVPCRALTIANAPDNVSGAYVFRVGLDIAIAAVPTKPDGVPCSLRWNGSTLEP